MLTLCKERRIHLSIHSSLVSFENFAPLSLAAAQAAGAEHIQSTEPKHMK
jgi:hypothetical protein